MSKPYRKFQLQQNKIENLERSSPRFKRIFSEYKTMSEDLWELENSVEDNVPDDFIESIKLQASYLEDEIEDWLLDEPSIED